MKNILPIIILFVVSFIASIAVIALLFTTKPELFGRGGPDLAALARADSVKTAETMTQLRRWHPSYYELAGIDTTKKAPVVPVDSAAALAGVIKKDSVKAPALAVAVPDSSRKSSADSLRAKERKSMAKVFESMQAESAAKILKDLSDEDIREIILSIKKRQAAKILAALDPDRAARIMR